MSFKKSIWYDNEVTEKLAKMIIALEGAVVKEVRGNIIQLIEEGFIKITHKMENPCVETVLLKAVLYMECKPFELGVFMKDTTVKSFSIEGLFRKMINKSIIAKRMKK